MELHNLHTYHTQGEILDPHTMISYDFPTHVIRDMIPISDLMFRLVEWQQIHPCGWGRYISLLQFLPVSSTHKFRVE